ncbi:FAD dependent oxidoreductase [Phlyctochytrium arcticum]|nr:FAD dependent oxidoreductase [Phlyctochytrium arcticum]
MLAIGRNQLALRGFKSISVIARCRRFASTRADVEVENLVIGGGVVGLAIGERLSRRTSETTVVLERHSAFGVETSSRNSEVIHAGIYYPPDSLKTRLCVRGNRLMHAFLRYHQIPHLRIGKWIVANGPDQIAYLDRMRRHAQNLGIELVFLSTIEKEAEPRVLAEEVLFSKTTGILDSHSFMETLESLIKSRGSIVAYNTPVAAVEPMPDGRFLVQMSDQPTSSVVANTVINAAGLGAVRIAQMVDKQTKHTLYPCKGVYYAYTGKSQPVKRLIYPVPDKHLQSLGVHATVDLAGQVKFGPNVEYVSDEKDLGVSDSDELRKQFVTAIGKYLKGIEADNLRVDYAGMRPKLAGPGEPFKDFVIESLDGRPNLINLLGIESPGLTSSLAIAEYVANLLGATVPEEEWEKRC